MMIKKKKQKANLWKQCFISEISNTFVDNADLYTVTPMYNFLEYSGKYSMTSGSSGIFVEMK